MLSNKYSQITHTILSFLIPGTRPSSLYPDQGKELLGKLAIRILASALAESSYSASLIVQLTQLLVDDAQKFRGDRVVASSIQLLAPIVVSYCIVRLTVFLTAV